MTELAASEIVANSETALASSETTSSEITSSETDDRKVVMTENTSSETETTSSKEGNAVLPIIYRPHATSVAMGASVAPFTLLDYRDFLQAETRRAPRNQKVSQDCFSFIERTFRFLGTE